jgi:4-hydroxybenzoate polyprenyltransferase
MPSLSSRLLALLQFTRFALVFTALADTSAALLLRAGSLSNLRLAPTLTALATSASLYTFGMALNDLVDYRKDKLLAANRPIPSGRLGVYTAHIIVSLLALSSLAFGGLYAALISSPTSFALLLLTLLLISFYNFAGKYLVSVGILTLGTIRLFHATIPAPDIPVPWHPLWLFTHVVVISSVAYVWEEKRPRITPVHAAILYTGTASLNVLAIATLLILHSDHPLATLALTKWTHALAILLPVAATFLFIRLANRIAAAVGPMTPPATEPAATVPVAPTLDALHSSDPKTPIPAPLRARRRQAGQRLILAGLLYLIVYDAAFVLGYVGPLAALLVLTLLPIAYLAVRLMRAWASVVQLTQPPAFRRANQLSS